MRSLKFSLLSLLLTATLSGQDLDLEVGRVGGLIVVSAVAEDAAVRDVFVALAAKSGLRLNLMPGAPEVMDGAHLPLQVERMPIGEFVDHLAGFVGLTADVDDAIQVRTPPAVGAEEAREWARDEAIDAWIATTMVGSATVGREALYRVGLLRLSGGQWLQAMADLEQFAVANREDARAPRALILAADAALAAGDPARHELLIDSIVEQHAHIHEVMHAHLRKVALLIRRGEFDAALPLLSRVEDDAEDARLRVLAMLMHAELWYTRGDGAKAVEILAGFDANLRRSYPELAQDVALYEGLSLMRASQEERALSRLQSCLLSERADLRVRGALGLARVYLSLGHRLAALENVRIALKQGAAGSALVSAHLLEAEILVQLGLGERALRAYERVAENLPPEAPESLRGHLLRGTAGVLFQRRAFGEALEIYELLSLREETKVEGLINVARCLIELGRHRTAVARLDEVPRDVDGAMADQVSRLRGACFVALGEFGNAATSFGAPRRRSINKENDR